MPILKRPLTAYYIIALAIPTLILAIYAFFPGFYDWIYGRPFVYEDAALEAARRLGYDNVSTNLFERIPAVFLEPVLAMPIIYAAAPTIAAILVTLFFAPKGAFGEFVSRYNPFRANIPILNLLGVYGFLVAVAMVVRIPLVLTVGADLVDFAGIISFTTLTTFAAYAFVDQGGLLEEGGWRAFALPYLQDHMKTPLAASIAVGLLWSLWHVPRDLLDWDSTVAGFFSEYGMFTFGTVSISIVITYFFNKAGGSVWPAVILHGLINQSFVMAGSYADAQSYPVILGQPAPLFAVYAAMGLMAIGFVMVCGPQLGRDGSTEKTVP